MTSSVINLPSISSTYDGKVLIIKDETGSASSYPITVNSDGSDTIDGLTQSQLTSDYDSLKLLRTSRGWWKI